MYACVSTSAGAARAVLLHERFDKASVGAQRIVAGVEEPHLGAEQVGRALRLGAADVLDALDGHARLLPGALALAAFAEGQAQDAHAVAARRVERDGATGTPDEVGGMRAEHEHCGHRLDADYTSASTGRTVTSRHVRTLLGDYPTTHALRSGRLTSSLVPLAFADVTVPNKAFKRVVRDLEFDVAELALMTFLMARSRGVPLRLLPVVVFSRNPLPLLICDRDRRLRPADLAESPRRCSRVHDDHGRLDACAPRRSVRRRARDAREWMTLEEGHVAGVRDPATVRRAAPAPT